MSIEQFPNFLDKKYNDLAGSKPVERAAQKVKRSGEKVPHERGERIENYLDRLESVTEDPRGLELLKNKTLNKYVTKLEDIPESYWQSQEKEARRRGESGDLDNANQEQIESARQKHAETVLNDQKSSLEQWIDYFASPDSDSIPNALKYWIFRNVTNLQEMVKRQGDNNEEYIEFPKRSKGTIKPFPDINYEALAYVVDAMINKLDGQKIEYEHDVQAEERAAFDNFLAKEDFAKLYAWANELMNPVPERLLPVTEGEWIQYKQWSDPVELVRTIRGKGTGWCTAGLNTAKTQLEGGDFYVYYSLDDTREAKIPRLAIRMQGSGEIAEDPRGIAYKQNIDPYMLPVLDEKLKEFGVAGEEYKKKSSDMKILTVIEHKTNSQEALDKAELIFLYEIDNKIEGFGYQRDQRITELRQGRNINEDLLVIFDCSPDQIAHNVQAIREDTKVYVGQLEPNIFERLPVNIEHIYTSFPDHKIIKEKIETGGKSAEQLISEMAGVGIKVTPESKYMLESTEFVPSKNTKELIIIRLTSADLGLRMCGGEQICERAQILGLDLCPVDTGPNYLLQYKNQLSDECIIIGTSSMPDTFYRSFFSLGRFDDGDIQLGSYGVDQYDDDVEWVFCLRK